jgi:hypothetical protein
LQLIDDLNLWDCLIFTSSIDKQGNIATDPHKISKGRSYNGIQIPKFLSYKEVNSDYKNRLYLCLLSAFNKKTNKNKLSFQNIEYTIESKALISNKRKNLLSLIYIEDQDTKDKISTQVNDLFV